MSSNALLKNHNASQMCEVRQLIEREAWLLSEQMGEDCTQTETGRAMLNNRICFLVTHGVGEWMNQLEATAAL